MIDYPYPNLAGVATPDLVEKVGGGSYQASYINWSRTMGLLRQHAPGWLPALLHTPEGQIVHSSPGVGGFLLIGFAHADGRTTPAVPQAIMDNRNQAVPLEKITARDITDTHRRGVCMAAALTFGLAYELWAKMPLESGYQDAPTQPQERPSGGPKPLAAPKTWAKLTEMVSAYDQQTHDVFFQFADSVRRYLFPDSTDTKSLSKGDRDVMFQKCAGAAVNLREQFDPNEMPGPGVRDVRAVFAAVLDGLELAIPDENES